MRMYQVTELERQFVVDTLRAVKMQEDPESVDEQIDDSLEIMESLQPAEVKV